jgi:hypothetical protein
MGIADTHAPFFGLVDVAIPTDAFAGSVYGSAWPGNAPLARWVEQENWLWSISQKRDRVRGVYWGNYFGPEILLRLGGKEAFVEKFTSVARSHDGTPDAQCWSFANGVFVSLCLNPQDCRPGLPLGIDFAAQRNLQWLVRELGPAGVLNPW